MKRCTKRAVHYHHEPIEKLDLLAYDLINRRQNSGVHMKWIMALKLRRKLTASAQAAKFGFSHATWSYRNFTSYFDWNTAVDNVDETHIQFLISWQRCKLLQHSGEGTPRGKPKSLSLKVPSTKEATVTALVDKCTNPSLSDRVCTWQNTVCIKWFEWISLKVGVWNWTC
jgi:hypothetical protein